AITDGIDILISHGHKKIGFIGALPELSTTQERFLAYKNQLAKNNLEINPELILFTHKLESDNQIQIKQILENGCTAIVACNNLITTNIIIYCDNHKISIPEQVEILGYKNSDRMDYFLPESLYIKQPVLQMGRIAATRMLQILSDEEPTTQNSIIPSALDIDFSNSNRN
ncbi:MAG: substrate-binding domain-containing protein, partial [Sphaerochaetaceae bacterium]